jgi:3-oxoacyl-[acyl-carrier-protein] synthase II
VQPALRPWITGIGLITPIGSDPATFWDALVCGRGGASSVCSFDTSALPNHVGCEVGPLVLDDASRRAVGRGGRCTELALAAASRAAEHAGLRGELAAREDAAVVVGTTMGEVTDFEQTRARHPRDEPGPDDVRHLVQRPLGTMARAVAAAHGIAGPVLTVPAACAAGGYAVGLAASMIRRGVVRAAIAVGCEAFSRLAFVGFSRMRAMSSDVCRPFSLGRPGLLLGEGAGALVLEAPDAARARGARALARLDGFGLSCDAHHVTGPHPRGDGAARAMLQALLRADLVPRDIDYVNAHGTGTELNDRMEAAALRAVFGDGLSDVPVSSVKALTGHMMGAAGAVEAIASLLALQHGLVPPTWNFLAPDPACAVDCVPNAPRRRALRHVMSNSYAFGGNNATLILTAPEA